MGATPCETGNPVRLDKWLWAARFFKTRSLAKQAVEGGKVHYNGQRVKPSKALEVGAELKIRCGWDDKIVIVCELLAQRRNAVEAAKLYLETDASLAAREAGAAERKATRGSAPQFDNRPTKKQRRQIHRFKQQGGTDA